MGEHFISWEQDLDKKNTILGLQRLIKASRKSNEFLEVPGALVNADQIDLIEITE